MPTQISHHSFARQSLMRRIIRTNKGCDWCGQNNHNRLFEYGNQPDSSYRTNWSIHVFCSVDCYRAYHG